MTKGSDREHRVVVVSICKNYHKNGTGRVGFKRIFLGDWE